MKCIEKRVDGEVKYSGVIVKVRLDRAHLDEDEFLNVEKHPLSELAAMAERNELEDGKTIIAVLKAERLLGGKK